MNHHPVIRADLDVAIKDFGHSRVAEGVSRLARKHGLGILTAEALAELHQMLVDDEEFAEAVNAHNRALILRSVLGDHEVVLSAERRIPVSAIGEKA